MKRRVLLGSVFFVAACALVYELALGTLASFTLGDAVTEFSITLGLYLFAMGLGAFVSKRIGADAALAYVVCELLLAIVGGASVPIVMHLSPGSTLLRPVLYGFIVLVGALVGVELPLLIRLLKEETGFDEAVSFSLASDYAGALLASCVFPFLCVPFLGLVRTTLVTGAANAILAVAVAAALPMKQKKAPIFAACGAIASALLVLTFASDAWRLSPSE